MFFTMTTDQITQRLAHVRWLGGSPCAGKSSVATLLAERFGWQVYRCDDALKQHQQRIDPIRQSMMYRLTQSVVRGDWNTIWSRSVDQMVADEFAFFHEEWSMIVDDLLALPTDQIVLAEGTALLPDLIQPVLRHERQAIWLVPTANFQRRVYPESRAWAREIVAQCEKPDHALRNWMDRDVWFANVVEQNARDRELAVVRVDQHRSIADYAALVADHFAGMSLTEA